MNGKLILQLSMVGLAMALGTVYFIPSRLETVLWPAVFLASAYLIARRAPARFFLHGFLVGLTNWVWVASAHVILRDAYFARHAAEAAAFQAMPMLAGAGAAGPVLGPALLAMRRYDLPIPGASGLVIGTLAWIASKILRRNGIRLARQPPAAAS